MALQADPTKPHVADVETKGNDPKNGKLLGVSIAPLDGSLFADGSEAAYVVVQEYVFARSEWRSQYDEPVLLIPEGSTVDDCTGVAVIVKYKDQPPQYAPGLHSYLQAFFANTFLVGHSFCYDRGWLDHFFTTRTDWHACTRIMWHMSSAPAKADGYALKEAQVKVLGWPERGDRELEEQVEARGGSLKKGDHYLADTDVLGYYAGLDAISTAELYRNRKPHFDKHEQWDLLGKVMAFTILLDRNTRQGILTDVPKLEKAAADLKVGMETSRADIRSLLSKYVSRLEAEWREAQCARYSDTPIGRTAKQKFLEGGKWKRFNPGSDAQKRELFYDVMRLPKVKKVKPRKNPKTGKRQYSDNYATTFEAISLSIVQSQRQDLIPVLNAYEKAEYFETMHNNFAAKWLKMIRGGRIHPSFDTSRTVSYRTAGRDPNFMAPPFDEVELMSCFTCDPGRGGVHADLTAVEPTLTAHYSQDPNLLKVFRDGIGDVYLDLALTLFPNDKELHDTYNPMVPCTSEVKEKLKKQRKKAKVVQLAVQYTGTEYAVSASLRCTLEEGAILVANYWKHYEMVARCNRRLVKLHDQRGYLTNAVGRVFSMPWPDHKDTPNRFFQSGGHDILILWALEIDRLCKVRGIDGEPILGDLHDATSWTAPIAQVPALREVFIDALAAVNACVGLSVPIRSEVKEFSSLAGLKADEVSLKEAA